MADCLFCRIARKEIPSQVVVETETTLAFRDINPGAPSHVLVIPKRHIGSLLEVTPSDAALLSDIHKTIQDVARKEKIDQNGFRTVVNSGSDAGQSVAHVHYHVLGGRSLAWPPG